MTYESLFATILRVFAVASLLDTGRCHSRRQEAALITTPAQDWINLGAYTLSQAAKLLGVRSDMVGRWIYGDKISEAAVLAQRQALKGELITFLDLIQAMAIHELRRQKSLSLHKIRQTVKAANDLGIEFPFARKHTTYIFRDEVVIRASDGRIIQATGKHCKQDLMEEILYPYWEHIGFDKFGVASIYTALRDGYRRVELSPAINFGAPTVLPCGYTVDTLVSSVDAEGSVDAAAEVCNVNPSDVRLALKYEQKLAA